MGHSMLPTRCRNCTTRKTCFLASFSQYRQTMRGKLLPALVISSPGMGEREPFDWSQQKDTKVQQENSADEIKRHHTGYITRCIWHMLNDNEGTRAGSTWFNSKRDIWTQTPNQLSIWQDEIEMVSRLWLYQRQDEWLVRNWTGKCVQRVEFEQRMPGFKHI